MRGVQGMSVAIAKDGTFLEQDRVDWIATEGSILVPQERCVVLTFGIKLRSQTHGWSNNWRPAHGRSKQLRKRTQAALHGVSVEHVTQHLRAPARTIVFVRLAKRKLDSDNNVAVFKSIRDQVCCWLKGENETWARASDSMRSGFEFEYRQQSQRAWGVRVELSA